MEGAGKLMHRSALLLALCLLLALVAVSRVAGCDLGERHRIKVEVTEALDHFKEPSSDDAVTLFGELGLGLDELEDAGMDTEEFARHLLGRFDYRIDGVEVDGDQATVALTITSTDNASLARQLVAEYSERGEDFVPTLLEENGESELVRQYFEELGRRIDAQTDTVTQSVTLRLSKTEGVWQADPASESELVRAMLGLEPA